MSSEEDDDVCMQCGDGGRLTLCDMCDGPFHSLGCEYPHRASDKNVCYCSSCQTIVFTQHQTVYTEHGKREIRLQGECLATNQVVYLQRPSTDDAVPFQVALDKLLALDDYVHVEPYMDGGGRQRFLIVGKLHDLNESQAWNAVSFFLGVGYVEHASCSRPLFNPRASMLCRAHWSICSIKSGRCTPGPPKRTGCVSRSGMSHRCVYSRSMADFMSVCEELVALIQRLVATSTHTCTGLWLATELLDLRRMRYRCSIG